MSDPEDIFNWRRLDERLTTSGQPTESQLAALQRLGVTHVINLGLHSHEKALPDEAATVAGLGMRYIDIPVDFNNPTEEDFERFCGAMAEAGDRKVHVHCIMNMRVTVFVYRYWRDVLGHDATAARAAMDSIWRPGGVWADFIGNEGAADLPHQYFGDPA